METLSSCFQGVGLYLTLGFEHILDPNGYDHILFVIALCAIYRVSEWRRILVLVTAFTLGHSFTLALSALNVFTMDPDLIETLIPITILITAINNLFRAERELSSQAVRLNYLLALFFGFIHGMGFSNYLRMLLGEESCIPGPLLMFNLGLELGQLIIVAVVMLLSWLVIDRAGLAQRWWNYAVSGSIALAALGLIFG